MACAVCLFDDECYLYAAMENLVKQMLVAYPLKII